MNGLLELVADAYQRNIGNPARQLVGNGVRGLLGLDPADYADSFGMEAYRNAQALSNAPTPLAFAALPAAMVKGAKAAKAVKAAPRDEALETARKNAVKMLGLPENNTAMDRAKALGFAESGYSGTARDLKTYDPSKSSGAGSGSREGPLGAWLTDDPRVAGVFADWSSRGQGGEVIYPLMIRGGKPWEAPSYLAIKDVLDANTQFVRPPYRMVQDKIDYDAARRALADKGDYVALRNTTTDSIDRPITQFLVTDPSRIRSRFAAFDPARVNENDLLGRADPALLALIAAGTALPVGYGLLTSNKDAKK